MNRSEETIGNDAQQNENLEDTSAHPMDAFLEEEAYGLDSPRRGEIRTGTIARITETDILVDIGFKSEGLIPGRELERLPQEKRDELIVGKEVTVYVLRAGGTDGTILLSIARAEEERDWLEAERLLKTKEVFEGVISGYNKGGLIVKLGRLRGFIPASQVSIARRWRSDGDSAEERWGKMVGETVVSKVIEVERRRNRLILSERAAAREARDLLKERLINELQEGEIRTGYVISLADFGAFVDIGGADGLVHTSEISWKRINHPRDLLKVGQKVEVKVLGVDPEQKRISLSLRELEEDPWEAIVKHYKEGQLIEGTITKLTKFGAFASLKAVDDYELEGLVHISELSDRHIVHPREVVSESETLTLRVIKVDRKRRRIGLSLKKVDSPEYAELDWQAAMEELQAGVEEGETTEEEGILVKAAVSEQEAEGEVELLTTDETDETVPSTEMDAQADSEVVEEEVPEVVPDDVVSEEEVQAVLPEGAEEEKDAEIEAESVLPEETESEVTSVEAEEQLEEVALEESQPSSEGDVPEEGELEAEEVQAEAELDAEQDQEEQVEESALEETQSSSEGDVTEEEVLEADEVHAEAELDPEQDQEDQLEQPEAIQSGDENIVEETDQEKVHSPPEELELEQDPGNNG